MVHAIARKFHVGARPGGCPDPDTGPTPADLARWRPAGRLYPRTVDPVPLSLVSAGRSLSEPRISPDGRWIGFVQRWRGGASINLAPIGGVGPERQLTFGPDPSPGRGLGGGCFTWITAAGEGEATIVYAAIDGELWWQRGAVLRQLTDHERSARAPAVAAGTLVYALDEAEIWRIDLGSNVARRLDDGRHAFCFDPAVSPDGTSVSWIGWSPPNMAWDAAVRVDLDLASGGISEWSIDDGAFQQPRFTPTGEAVHVHDGTGWLNVHIEADAVVEEQREHAGPTWGMGNRSFAFDGDGTRMAFTRNERGHGALVVVDRVTGHIEQLGRGVHGQLTWVGDHIAALRSGARTPPQIVSYRAPSWDRHTIVLSVPDGWPLEELPEPELIETRSSDDALGLYARRFVAGNGRLLVWVHGGPTDQWQVEWRPRINYWWSRGWDVLVVDPRGTTGHGREHQQALHGNWGRSDVDDTADLIRLAHRAGWSTPDSTVVVGGSSGGLTALGVLADHPELVAGGVTSYPVSDLRALTEVTHRFEAHYTDTLVAPNDGSAASDAAFRALSPIHRAASIAKPLLLMHGSDDPVVPIEQSERLVAAIREGGGDVDFVVYDEEGHGFRRPETVADEYARTEVFLDRLVAET